MKFKILKPNKPDDWSFNDDEELYKALGFDCWDDHVDWKDPGTWDSYSHWICMTKAGKEYHDKILKPKLYEKYKDMVIEV